MSVNPGSGASTPARRPSEDSGVQGVAAAVAAQLAAERRSRDVFQQSMLAFQQDSNKLMQMVTERVDLLDRHVIHLADVKSKPGHEGAEHKYGRPVTPPGSDQDNEENPWSGEEEDTMDFGAEALAEFLAEPGEQGPPRGGGGGGMPPPQDSNERGRERKEARREKKRRKKNNDGGGGGGGNDDGNGGGGGDGDWVPYDPHAHGVPALLLRLARSVAAMTQMKLSRLLRPPIEAEGTDEPVMGVWRQHMRVELSYQLDRVMCDLRTMGASVSITNQRIDQLASDPDHFVALVNWVSANLLALKSLATKVWSRKETLFELKALKEQAVAHFLSIN